MKWVHLILGRFLAFLLLFILASLLFIASPQGLNLIGHMAERYAPGYLHYQTLSGHLLKNIIITKFEYRHEDVHIQVDYLELDWSPLRLFKKEVYIKKLAVINSTVILPKTKTTQNSTHHSTANPAHKANLSLPISIEINQAIIKNFQYGTQHDHTPILINYLDFSSLIDKNNLIIRSKLNIAKPWPGTSELTVTGSPAHYLISMVNEWPMANWIVRGSGNLQFLNLQIIPAGNS